MSSSVSRDAITEMSPFPTAGAVTPSYYFWYNNSTMIIQAIFSLFLAVFTATMLAIGRDPTIYLPILTGITTIWIPSPLNHKITPPSQGPATALSRASPITSLDLNRRSPVLNNLGNIHNV